jgi:hypothetical protein
MGFAAEELAFGKAQVIVPGPMHDDDLDPRGSLAVHDTPGRANGSAPYHQNRKRARESARHASGHEALATVRA